MAADTTIPSEMMTAARIIAIAMLPFLIRSHSSTLCVERSKSFIVIMIPLPIETEPTNAQPNVIKYAVNMSGIVRGRRGPGPGVGVRAAHDLLNIRKKLRSRATSTNAVLVATLFHLTQFTVRSGRVKKKMLLGHQASRNPALCGKILYGTEQLGGSRATVFACPATALTSRQTPRFTETLSILKNFTISRDFMSGFSRRFRPTMWWIVSISRWQFSLVVVV